MGAIAGKTGSCPVGTIISNWRALQNVGKICWSANGGPLYRDLAVSNWRSSSIQPYSFRIT